ncbi:hypothetical protein K2173_005828 [Erythroxylum novogranatense]|uniref:DUF868 family protein n=1 Tax=Erythroxylum novogranatense TaxID=1862640 RepID=A0AAV8U2R6_9ROSI|nr:hypothetical protein K2173_005828 [Erythroxylum novogranatense]
MMHESLGIPACFSSSERQNDDPATVIRSGQSAFMSIYRTKLAGQCRLITITWCKDLLLHGLSVTVQATNGRDDHHCKVELKPWNFWRKQGSKQFVIDDRIVDVVWDFKAAKFNGETEPQSDYYLAIICEEEVALLLGDLKKNAYRRTRCRPSLIEPILVSRKEHVFGKKRFTTRIKSHEKGQFVEISIECKKDGDNGEVDPQLEIKADGQLAIQVKHLQWKFRGNDAINLSKTRVEVCWDVHDWLFGSGPRHGLFIIKPVSQSPLTKSAPSSPTSSLSSTSMPFLSQEVNSASVADDIAGGPSSFCLFLYAWKMN